MFSPYWAPKKNIFQNASASLLTFVETIGFFDGFKGGKIGSWVKLLHFTKIIPPNLQSNNEDYLREFAQCFELGEDSLIIDFDTLVDFRGGIYSTLKCNFFRFFANFSLKKVVIRNFWIENDEFKDFVSFLAGNRSSLVQLELQGIKFDKCDECVRKLFFPNLENIVIDCCSRYW